MKKTVFAAAMITGLGLSAAAVPAMAYEAGDWLVRGRIINVNPNDDSGNLYIGGASTGSEGVEVDSDTVPELDITYMLTRNWGLELILGYSEHTVKAHKTWSALGDVIDTKVLPPTLTLQYHFLPDSTVRPYVGVGVNYTYFFDEEVSGSVLDIPGADVKLDSSWGLAAQAGVDVALNQDWFVNFDVKYIDIDTEAHFSGTPVGRAKITADIDPFVWGIGIGRRF
ncbi:MAG: OmpW family protein [Methylophaga sp.]|jgi:outer membrane protein|nr:OmpW family protein [Methylophaga sp.]